MFSNVNYSGLSSTVLTTKRIYQNTKEKKVEIRRDLNASDSGNKELSVLQAKRSNPRVALKADDMVSKLCKSQSYKRPFKDAQSDRQA